VNEYPAALVAFAWIGLWVTAWAGFALLYAANYALIAWWQRRQARRTTTEESR
jgi:hypothetical protein